MSFSVFPRVTLPFPQFALFHSVAYVQLGLITIVGNRGCVAVASFRGRGHIKETGDRIIRELLLA
jgi:hypothetical protein